MAFRDILLALTSYPEPTPVSVVEDAVSVAATLGAHIAALSCEMHVQVPGHFISGAMVGLPGIIAGEAARAGEMRRTCSQRSTQPRQSPAFPANRCFRNARRSKSRTCWSNTRGFAISRSCRSQTIDGMPRP